MEEADKLISAVLVRLRNKRREVEYSLLVHPHQVRTRARRCIVPPCRVPLSPKDATVRPGGGGIGRKRLVPDLRRSGRHAGHYCGPLEGGGSQLKSVWRRCWSPYVASWTESIYATMQARRCYSMKKMRCQNQSHVHKKNSEVFIGLSEKVVWHMSVPGLPGRFGLLLRKRDDLGE